MAYVDNILRELYDFHAVDKREILSRAISAIETESMLADQLYKALVEVLKFARPDDTSGKSLFQVMDMSTVSSALAFYQQAREFAKPI